MSALGLFSRAQITRIYSYYRQEYPFDNTKDDRLVRHHFLQRIQNRLAVHSMSALSFSGAFAFFTFQFLEQKFQLTTALRKYSSNDMHSKMLMAGSMVFIYWASGRLHYINLNDLVDIRTEYGREFVSVVMKRYPHKVNYELIQHEAADLLRVAQIQNHQPYQQNYAPQQPTGGFFTQVNQQPPYGPQQPLYPNQQQQQYYGQPYQPVQPYSPSQGGYTLQQQGFYQPSIQQQAQQPPMYPPYAPQIQSHNQATNNQKPQPIASQQNQAANEKQQQGGEAKEEKKREKTEGVINSQQKPAESLFQKGHVGGVRTMQFQQPSQLVSSPSPPTQSASPPIPPPTNHQTYLPSGTSQTYQNGYYMVAGQNPSNQANPVGLSSSVGFTPYHQVGQPRYTGYYSDVAEQAKQGNH